MLYDMVGIFIQPFLGNGIFVGNDLQHNEDDNRLVGKLDDYYGPSKIEGTLNLSRGEMKFNKIYRGTRPVINYEFEKQGDLWVGKYSGKDTMGETMCEIFGVEEPPKFNWNDMVKTATLSPFGTDEWAKRMVKEMEQEGYIEIVKDPETGENFVKPLDKTP